MTTILNEYNITQLTKDKDKFLEYSKKIEDKFSGPSEYFYQKIVSQVRNTQTYSSLFENTFFFECLYATLATWGMNRMDQNTRMAEFQDFSESIIKLKGIFEKLSDKKLRDIVLNDHKSDILTIFKSLMVMQRSEAPKIVANSKIMHFLLLDLIPPMDKAHVYNFFYGKKNIKGKFLPPIIKDEDGVFWDILTKYQEIANRLDLQASDLRNKWDTSIPKIIDNSIIGFNITQ